MKRLTLSNMVLCCLLSSVIASYIGLMNFIGLIAPHIVRLVVGNNHVYLLPGSAIAGALIPLLDNLFARVVISPVILPFGAITSFLGGSMFVLLRQGGVYACGGKEVLDRDALRDVYHVDAEVVAVQKQSIVLVDEKDTTHS